MNSTMPASSKVVYGLPDLKMARLYRCLKKAEGPCIEEICIGDPYGYWIRATEEFLNSSSRIHSLSCLKLSWTVCSSPSFIKLFHGLDDDTQVNDSGRGINGIVAEESHMSRCGFHCLSWLEKKERKDEIKDMAEKEEDEEMPDQNSDLEVDSTMSEESLGRHSGSIGITKKN
jgi:hypothetical protein